MMGEWRGRMEGGCVEVWHEGCIPALPRASEVLQRADSQIHAYNNCALFGKLTCTLWN